MWPLYAAYAVKTLECPALSCLTPFELVSVKKKHQTY